MPAITFITAAGTEYPVEAEIGMTAMRVALNQDIPGIIADCGGALTCASCHVYVDPAWLERVGPASAEEEAMIECAVDPEANSRLSCQIEITDALDGLVLHVPKAQF